MTSAERAQRLNGTILDLRLALTNPQVQGERRQLLRDELVALRCARLGVTCRGQRSILRRLGLAPSGAVRRARD
jgi:hypothetical protein